MTRSDNFLAVCMPAYNAECSIASSINSILSQSYGCFTFIITDDCSSDGTLQVINDISDSRILVLKNSVNRGVVATRNSMMKYCIDHGFKYLAVMDSDDIAYPDRLKKQIEILENDPSLTVCGSSMKMESSNSVWQAPVLSSEIKAECVFANPIPTSTATMRLADIERYDLYWNDNYAPCADYHLWYVMLFEHNLRARNTGDVDMTYTFSPEGVSYRDGIAQQEKKDTAVKQLILRQFDISPTLQEVRHFMRVALSRSSSAADALDFYNIALALKQQNGAVVDQRSLDKRLDHRVNIYLGRATNLDKNLKNKIINNLTINKSYSRLDSLLRRIKHNFLDKYFPRLSYKILLLYKSFRGRFQ